MTSALKEKIIERMEAKNLSIAELERLAGLSIHSVRNIVKGRIKRPSAQSLQAIAEVLECSIVDLVDKSPLSIEDPRYAAQRRKKNSIPLAHPILMQECCAVVLEIATEYMHEMSVDDYMDMVKKVYTYSSKEAPIKLDLRFAQWLVETQFHGLQKRAVDQN